MKFLAAFFFIALSLTAGAAKTIQIGEETFHLAESKGGEPAALEEYLLKGQTFDNYKKLVAVRRLPKIDSPKEYIGSMVTAYQRQYPEMTLETGSGPGGLYFIDFLIYTLGAGPKFLEWNYFVARSSTTGIIVYQYAERVPYKNELKEGFEALNPKALRTRMLPILRESVFVSGTPEKR